MKIRILGAGWYGCHIASELLADGHDVEVREIQDEIFMGASGKNPARLHKGFHYPRSTETRRLSQSNLEQFMQHYGHLTRAVPVNIYAVAANESMVDFSNYVKVLKDELDFVVIERPEEFGLRNVEGAVLTGERHILVNRVREHFKKALGDRLKLGVDDTDLDKNLSDFDVTIDCTFCALDRHNVARYEPCVTYVYSGDYDRAVTIMDGPFPSIYPHYEKGTVSVTSAKYTPLAKVKTSEEAQAVIEDTTHEDLRRRRMDLEEDMNRFYAPFPEQYHYVDAKLAVRAMPLSGADSRIFEVHENDGVIRMRSGKIDAIFSAAEEIKRILNER